MIRRGYEEATGDSAGAIRGCRESIGGRGAIWHTPAIGCVLEFFIDLSFSY